MGWFVCAKAEGKEQGKIPEPRGGIQICWRRILKHTNLKKKQVRNMDEPTNLTFFLSRVPEYELETFHEKELATSPPPA